MNNLLVLFLLSLFNLCTAQTHIIFTSALISEQYQLRKQEYKESLSSLKRLGMNPWIIESTPIKRSFFDKLSSQVLYPQTNDPTIQNIGVNEVMAIKKCIPFLPFNDEDIVIKLTGRYLLYDNFLLNTILQHPECDAFAKWIGNEVFTGCIALRWKHFKQALDSIDLKEMEEKLINLETLIANYIIDQKLTCSSLETLHCKARVFGWRATSQADY